MKGKDELMSSIPDDIEKTINNLNIEDFCCVAGNLRVSYLCSVIDLLNPCMDDYLYLCDFEDDYYYISPSAMAKFPLKSNAFHNIIKGHELFVYPKDLPMLQEDLESVLKGNKNSHNLRYRWIDKQGRPIWINCRGTVVRDEVSGKPLYMVGCINEIGARQKADNVSGLMGPSAMKEMMDSYVGPFPDGYILRLGIDDFKSVNERLGVEYGDMVMLKVAERIQECLSSQQFVFRAPSDGYYVIDFSNSTEEDGIRLYKDIRSAVDKFVEDSNYEAVFTISGGLLPTDSFESYDYDSVMKMSEFAMNKAKLRGKNNCYTFKNEDYDSFIKKRRLTRALKKSVGNGFSEFKAYYQPLFNTETGEIYGAEALMRYEDKEYGLVSPVDFIPILEETRLIIPAGRWILKEAVKTCKYVNQFIPGFKISVNISYIQVEKSKVFDDINEILEEFDLDPECLIIELTESGEVVANEHIRKMWSKLKRNGVMVALDDFGTGASNFHYLNDLRPDILKIDRSFTAEAVKNEYEYNLLSLISNMGHNLKLKICIEGIENHDEFNKMKTLSPEYCQGFLFGKPCEYQEFHKKYILNSENSGDIKS